MFRDDPFSGHVVIRTTDADLGRQQLPAVDDAESAARLLAAASTRSGWREQVGARAFPADAGEAALHAGRRTRPAARARAGRARRAARAAARHRDRRTLASSNGACSSRSSASSRPTRSCAIFGRRARARPGSISRRSPRSRDRSTSARVIGRFSTFLEHVKPTAGNERVDALQCALPLGGAAGTRDRGGLRGRPALRHHARVLARGRPRVSRRQRHGRRARDGETSRAWRTRPRSTSTCARPASTSRTPTSSGAAAARSSRRRSRRRAYREFCAARGIDPERCDAADGEEGASAVKIESVAGSPHVVAALAVALGGCTKVVERRRDRRRAHPWTVPGVLRFAESQDPKNLNPLLNSARRRSIFRCSSFRGRFATTPTRSRFPTR